MKQLLKFGLVLGLICCIATAVLAVTYRVAKPKIDEQLRQEEERGRKETLPDADSFNRKTVDEIEYFEGMRAGKLVGYCIKVVTKGYGGYIRLMVGVDTRGVIKGVKILEHHETPGLGSKINEALPDEKEPWFLRQFKGTSAKAVSLDTNIDAITGATISSTAVTDAIRDTVTEFFSKVGR